MRKYIIAAGAVFFAAAWIVSLAIYAHYGYVGKLNKIETGDCIIVSKTKDTTRVGGSEKKNSRESYFYRIGTGKPEYNLWNGKYYTIDVGYSLPWLINITKTHRTFTDGYRSEKTRNEVFEKHSIGSKTRCTWNRENTDDLYVTVNAHMRTQIIGISFMTIFTVIFIVLAVVAVIVVV